MSAFISPKEFGKNVDTLDKAIAFVVNSHHLEYLPKRFLVPKVYEVAVDNYYPLSKVPMKHRTPRVCYLAAKRRQDSLREVPHTIAKEVIALIALSNSNYNLKCLSPDLWTETVCVEAVRNNLTDNVSAPYKQTVKTIEAILERIEALSMDMPAYIKNHIQWELLIYGEQNG